MKWNAPQTESERLRRQEQLEVNIAVAQYSLDIDQDSARRRAAALQPPEPRANLSAAQRDVLTSPGSIALDGLGSGSSIRDVLGDGGANAWRTELIQDRATGETISVYVEDSLPTSPQDRGRAIREALADPADSSAAASKLKPESSTATLNDAVDMLERAIDATSTDSAPSKPAAAPKAAADDAVFADLERKLNAAPSAAAKPVTPIKNDQSAATSGTTASASSLPAAKSTVTTTPRANVAPKADAGDAVFAELERKLDVGAKAVNPARTGKGAETATQPTTTTTPRSEPAPLRAGTGDSRPVSPGAAPSSPVQQATRPVAAPAQSGAPTPEMPVRSVGIGGVSYSSDNQVEVGSTSAKRTVEGDRDELSIKLGMFIAESSTSKDGAKLATGVKLEGPSWKTPGSVAGAEVTTEASGKVVVESKLNQGNPDRMNGSVKSYDLGLVLNAGVNTQVKAQSQLPGTPKATVDGKSWGLNRVFNLFHWAPNQNIQGTGAAKADKVLKEMDDLERFANPPASQTPPPANPPR